MATKPLPTNVVNSPVYANTIIGLNVSNGGSGYSPTIFNNSNISFKTRYGQFVTLRHGDEEFRTTEEKLVELLKANEELKQLCEEQPAVKEAYERLETLIKLYRE